jgi:hypothetical protein
LKNPQIKYLWVFADNLNTESELRTNGKLLYHGKRIIETIGVALKSINNPDVLDVLLIELGSRHFAYGLKPEYFSVIFFLYINFLTLTSTCFILLFRV